MECGFLFNIDFVIIRYFIRYFIYIYVVLPLSENVAFENFIHLTLDNSSSEGEDGYY